MNCLLLGAGEAAGLAALAQAAQRADGDQQLGELVPVPRRDVGELRGRARLGGVPALHPRGDQLVRRVGVGGPQGQHVLGERRLLHRQVVAQRGARHRRPAAVTGERDDQLAQRHQAEPLGHAQHDLPGQLHGRPGPLAHDRQVEGGGQQRRGGDVGGQPGRHPRLLQPRRALGIGRGLAAQQPARQAGPHGRHGCREPVPHLGDRRRGLLGELRLAQDPAGGALGQAGRLGAQLHLGGRRHHVVQRPDGVPHPVHVEDRARDGVREHHPGQRGAGLLRQPEQAGHAGDVHGAVGQDRRDDLPPQRVAGDRRGEPLAQRSREVVDQQTLEGRVVGQPGVQHLVPGLELGVGEQDRQLRTGQRLAVAPPLGQLAVVGQRLHAAQQPARALQAADEPLVRVEQAARGGHLDGQGRVLRVVVAEDGDGDVVGHLAEQRRAVGRP